MSTLNGIGTKFNGYSNKSQAGTYHVTRWITFLYFPIIPIKAFEIKREITHARIFKYHTIQPLKLNAKEIFATYLYGWLITPLLMFWPMPFAVREVGQALGYTNENAEGTFYHFVIAFAIIYLIVFVWKWKDWEETRGLPKNYKTVLAKTK